MVRPLLAYPDPSIRLISGNVRFFNEELRAWITDMIDTMRANDLEALSAILIGLQYNIVVIREGDRYIPYINAVLIKHSGRSTQTERSPYYPGISVDVERYEKVTVVYEDETGQEHYKDMEAKEARVFQHYLDYCYGSTFVDRVDRRLQERIGDHLEFGLVKDASGGACPTVFYRNYFKQGARLGMVLMALSCVVAPFLSPSAREMLSMIDRFGLLGVLGLIVGYFAYAQIEVRKYKQCTSCQTGNIVGSTALLLFWFALISFGVFFWVPS